MVLNDVGFNVVILLPLFFLQKKNSLKICSLPVPSMLSAAAQAQLSPAFHAP